LKKIDGLNYPKTMGLKVIQNDVKKRIAVAAGKGGVGKSTIAVLLAVALRKLGEKVGILDADLYGPSVRHMLAEERAPKAQEGGWLPATAQGIKLFSFAFFSQEPTVRAPIANHVLKQFLQNVFWGDLDWLLLDFPPGTGDIPLTVTQLVRFQGALIVTTPQKVATLDVQKTLAMFRKVQVPILGIIENMSYYKEEACTPFGAGGGQRLAEENGVPFLGKNPIEAAISHLADQGKLSEASLPIIDSIAKRLMQSDAVNGDEPVQSIMILNQKDLKIVWKNGTISCLRAHELQAGCPCAQCKCSKAVKKEVHLLGFERVGSYGVRFDFSSGCSYGIYPFEVIKGLMNVI
jgi:ATP-binding protein involved in chromosome partitioning